MQYRIVLLILLLIKSIVAVSQQPKQGITLAVEGRAGMDFRIPEPALGASAVGNINVKFNRFS